MSALRPPSRSWTERVFRALVRVFPFDFRVDHGREMEQTFRTQHQEVRREGTIGALVRSYISPEYAAAARLRLVDGRAFDTRDDADGTLVAIVNETLARQLWPNQSPIGQHLVADKARLEVVGVMRDGKYVNVNESPRGAIFRPLAQTGPAMATLAIRVSGPPVELARAVREAIRRSIRTWLCTTCAR